MHDQRKKVVIIGGGFAGLHAARALRKEAVEVTLIDRRNFHLFQPLLYQVATGGLSPADIAFPLRALFKKQRNVRVLLGTVTDIEFNEKLVFLADQRLTYDYLIIAAGSNHHYYGNSQWASLAPGLKTIEDATDIRNRILSAFEKAENEEEKEKRQSLLTFAIIGGGPAGVEMAGAIAELSRHTLLHDFRKINPSDACIMLIEGAERILPPYPETLSVTAQKTLEGMGVVVKTKARVTDLSDSGVTLQTAAGESFIPCTVKIWTAGVQASDLAEITRNKLPARSDKSGKLLVNPYCNPDADQNVFIIGDLAHFEDESGETLPGTAPVAMQQGRYVGQVIRARIAGKNELPFRYTDKGNLAVIGRKSAVAFRRKVRFSGLPAWLLWLFVHLLYLVGFENRVLVAVQWAFHYFSFNQSARLITGKQK